MQLKISSTILILCTLLISIGCNKNPDMPDDNDDPTHECADSFPSNLELEWSIPLNPDTLKDNSNHLGMVLNHVFYQSMHYNDFPFSQFLVDRDNGETIWDNIFPSNNPSYTDGPHLIQDYFVMQSPKTTYIFNSLTGGIARELDVHHVDSALGRQIAVSNENIYRVHTENTAGNGRYARLVELNTDGQIERSILKLERNNINGLHPTFISFQVFEDMDTGNEHLAFLMRGINYSTSETRVDLYVYDLDAGGIKYHYEDLTFSGDCSDKGLLINGDFAFIQGAQNVYCYELETGDRLWETAISDLSLECNMTFTKGTLIINPDSEFLIGIHPTLGHKKWQVGSNGGEFDFSGPTPMVTHNEYVYFGSRTTDRLSCVNINSTSASVIWNDYSPLALSQDPCEAGFNTQLAIDEEGGMLYANDNYFLMGIKLPE